MEETLEIMKPCEVARQLRCSVRTVARLADDGYLVAVRTDGGHRRFVRSDNTVQLNHLRWVRDQKVLRANDNAQSEVTQ